MMNKTILIVNDDGIQADGISKLARAAKQYGDVWVVAPDSQRSSMSHRINYSSPIDVWDYTPFVNGVKAFSCNGSPADCVRVGIKIIGKKPDVVLSGINNGYNIAADIQYSATVGAALEAAFWGIHAIAFSQDCGNIHEVTDRYLTELLEEYMEKKLTKSQIWNINFPCCPLNECKGILRDCIVSKDEFYNEDYSEKNIDEKHRQFKVIPIRNWNGSEGTDLFAVCNNYVSVGIVNNIG